MFFTIVIIIDQLVSVVMLTTLILRTNQSQLPKMDNITIKDKMPSPKLSIIGKFHCIHTK